MWAQYKETTRDNTVLQGNNSIDSGFLHLRYCCHFGSDKFPDVLGCLVHCKMFNSIPGIYPLNASSTPPSHDHQKCLQILQTSLVGKNHLVENHWHSRYHAEA